MIFSSTIMRISRDDVMKEEFIEILERQACRCANWRNVSVADAETLRNIRGVEFLGLVSVGSGASIENAVIENCTVGAGARIRNIGRRIYNCEIGEGAVIENVAAIEFDAESPCGLGATVCVLDETGSRPVRIYPGISSQMAMLAARIPQWFEDKMAPALNEYLDSVEVEHKIGRRSKIIDCGRLRNVTVGDEVVVEGALNLRDGMIVNNAPAGKCVAYVGAGVNAENFIIEDGSVYDGALVRNCYIGQGVSVGKGFTAHDSLFFANSILENGEACAVFAGPFTVSMHKSTLLIACQTSFMNAGSATNQSNHMYKLGPVHWGVLERGVKTSSSSYLMLGARIGAFSLLMGQHKYHPDTSDFPFSYLFGDERGHTVVMPGTMMKSCGMQRDQTKWPRRDKRVEAKLPLNDKLVFDVLNPATVGAMVRGIRIINSLLREDNGETIIYNGLILNRRHLEKGIRLYEIAIGKYLSLNDRMLVLRSKENDMTDAVSMEDAEEWIDMSGLPMPRHLIDKIKDAEDFREAATIFQQAFDDYDRLEKDWIAEALSAYWADRIGEIPALAAEYDEMTESDKQKSRKDLTKETRMFRI